VTAAKCHPAEAAAIDAGWIAPEPRRGAPAAVPVGRSHWRYRQNEAGKRSETGRLMILPRNRDPRFITVRRGGSLRDDHHQLLAIWAADCAQHVLQHFEAARPDDNRPRHAINLGRAWARGEVTWWEARTAAGHANAAARDLRGAARYAAYAAGQAAAVGHVAAHDLGAAAYAIRAVQAAAGQDDREEAGRTECGWQRAQLPVEIRDLVLDDQRLRNELCWFVFDC
jgi:Imm-5 like putative immunity protein